MLFSWLCMFCLLKNLANRIRPRGFVCFAYQNESLTASLKPVPKNEKLQKNGFLVQETVRIEDFRFWYGFDLVRAILTVINICYKVCSFDELSEEQKKAVNEAKEATKHSYCPYSHFHVGAAVQLENSEIYQGSNQENAAYGPTSCGERTALFYIHSKYSDIDIKRICCVACNDAQEFTESVCTPCGICRQVIYEFEAVNPHHSDIEVICGSKNEYYVFKSIKDLLPFGFGPSNLT